MVGGRLTLITDFKIPYDQNFTKQSIKKHDMYILVRFLGKESDFLKIKVPID